MGDPTTFSSTKEEIKYWKELALSLRKELVSTKEEMEEFETSSRELEAELEAQIEQLEKRNKELISNNEKMQNDTSQLREKVEYMNASTQKRITELEEEVSEVSSVAEQYTKYIQKLEQANDDLERTKRATVASLEDFEHRLNSAIERNALLENELDEKDLLAVTVQRLKDEARDLRHELDINKKDKDDDDDEPIVNSPESTTDSNKLADSGYIGATLNNQTTPGNRNSVSTVGSGTPLTPSARISALTIVGDLLRKVGALESKLASCRNFVKEQPRSSKPGGDQAGQRARRINQRGSSVSSQPKIECM